MEIRWDKFVCSLSVPYVVWFCLNFGRFWVICAAFSAACCAWTDIQNGAAPASSGASDSRNSSDSTDSTVWKPFKRLGTRKKIHRHFPAKKTCFVVGIYRSYFSTLPDGVKTAKFEYFLTFFRIDIDRFYEAVPVSEILAMWVRVIATLFRKHQQIGLWNAIRRAFSKFETFNYRK